MQRASPGRKEMEKFLVVGKTTTEVNNKVIWVSVVSRLSDILGRIC